MQATLIITALWIAFAASHMALSAASIRPKLVAALGEWPFRGLYSLIAFAIFIPLVRVYFENKHAGPLLWALPVDHAVRGLLYLGNGFAFVLIAAGYLNPSPAMVGVTEVKHRPIHDITRHPLFAGIGLWGLMHMLPNGSASDVAFFAGFILFAIAGAWHQDVRIAKTRGEDAKRFLAETPFFPFTGNNSLRGLRGFSPLAVVAGIAVAAVIRYFHATWFM